MKSLFGTNFFGDSIKQDMGGTIANKYIVPPFSVLNTREGSWQKRKKQWLKLGLQSEIGRNAKTYNTTDWIKDHKLSGLNQNVPNTDKKWTGTSIFDPVLCEIMYKWFCPPNGQIVDPFAGGSVRGVVANYLDYKYWGCDLRNEQIKANIQQGIDILKINPFIKIKISIKSLKQMFMVCEPNYIKENCKGRCCQGTNEIKVTVHKLEEKRIKKLGCKIKEGFIQSDERGLCPFKQDTGLCSIHNKKPFGCSASPFTLNKNNTLIVRNRYRLLKCYKNKNIKKPIYEAHKKSLIFIFGENETKNIIKAVKNNDEFFAKISYEKYKILIDNDFAKNKKIQKKIQNDLQWVCGDSLKEIKNAPKADFIFSCPPYGDLEKYSDNERDLSNMEYHTFIAAYKRIILKTCKRLKENRFACFVVGDFRDNKGFYRGFVSDTIQAFQEQGLKLYNECILINSIGSLPIRIQKQFDAYKKIGKTHQNVLIFYKGTDSKMIWKDI